jgi:hypothetical protein
MNRVSRLTIGALLTGAVLLPLAPAQAETVLQPAAETPSASQVSTDGGSGSASGSAQLLCTIIKLVLLNAGPAMCQ